MNWIQSERVEKSVGTISGLEWQEHLKCNEYFWVDTGGCELFANPRTIIIYNKQKTQWNF